MDKDNNETVRKNNVYKPSIAYVGASWFALATGFAVYCIGLWNAEILLSEKGYYFTILLFGLFSCVSLQKSVRDKMEGIPVTPIFYAIGWVGVLVSIVLLVIGLVNAEMLLSEKGFYGISFILTLFAAVSVQKNIRDLESSKDR